MIKQFNKLYGELLIPLGFVKRKIFFGKGISYNAFSKLDVKSNLLYSVYIVPRPNPIPYMKNFDILFSVCSLIHETPICSFNLSLLSLSYAKKHPEIFGNLDYSKCRFWSYNNSIPNDVECAINDSVEMFKTLGVKYILLDDLNRVFDTRIELELYASGKEAIAYVWTKIYDAIFLKRYNDAIKYIDNCIEHINHCLNSYLSTEIKNGNESINPRTKYKSAYDQLDELNKLKTDVTNGTLEEIMNLFKERIDSNLVRYHYLISK